MSKIIRNTLSFFLFFMSFGAFAQDVTKRFEIGTFTDSISISSNPVTGFSSSGKMGFTGKFVIGNIPNFNKNIEAVIGGSMSSMKLGLTGTGLGDIDSQVFMGGVRYRFSNEQIQPYVGIGVHFTSLDGSSLANNTVRVNQTGSGFGTYIEAGIRGNFPKDFFPGGFWHIGVQQFSNVPFILETTFGAAKISDVGTGTTRAIFGVGTLF